MKTIKISKGFKAFVDDEDFDWLSQWKWSCDSRGYAVRHQKKEEYGESFRKMVKMHRAIMKTPEGEQIDHINHNTLDNRKQNLRIVTFSQNQANSKISSRNISGYKGVVMCNMDKPFNIKKPWAARIVVNGKRIFKGMFGTKEEAAIQYNKLAMRYFGDFAYLNKLNYASN